MTLIEVVLSLVLAVMLMSAIIGGMRVVVLQTKYASSQAVERWPTQFIDLLYRDLLVAESVSSREGVIWIEGLAPSYSGSLIIEKRSVGYSCVPMESGNSGLLRIDRLGCDDEIDLMIRQIPAIRIKRVQSFPTPFVTEFRPTPSSYQD